MFDGLFKSLTARKAEAREKAAGDLQRRLAEKSTLVVDKNLIADLGVSRRVLYNIIYDLVRRERMYMLADAEDQMVLMTNAEFSRFMMRRAHGFSDSALPVLTEYEDADATLVARPSSDTIVARVAGMPSPTEEVLSDDPDTSIIIGPPGMGDREDFWEIPAAALDSTLAGSMVAPLTAASVPEPLGNGTGIKRSSEKTTRRLVKRLLRQVGVGSLLTGDDLPEEPPVVAEDIGWFNLDMTSADGEGPELPENRQIVPERKREPWQVFEEAEKELE